MDARDTLDDLEARHPLDLSSALYVASVFSSSISLNPDLWCYSKIGSAIFKGAKVAKQGYGQAKEYRRKRQSQHRRHRRGLDADEELSQRDLDAEELFRREFGDFFVERDAFDHDLD